MQCTYLRALTHTYQCRVRIERHPKIHCLPIDHDPISWAPVLVPTVHSTIHHRRRMYNSTLDWPYALPPTFSASNFDFCPATDSWNVEKERSAHEFRRPPYSHSARCCAILTFCKMHRTFRSLWPDSSFSPLWRVRATSLSTMNYVIPMMTLYSRIFADHCWLMIEKNVKSLHRVVRISVQQ